MKERGKRTGRAYLCSLLEAAAQTGKRERLVLADGVTLTDHAQNRHFQGKAAVRELLHAFFRDGFPEAEMEVKTVLADEQASVLELTLYGRQQGPFLGIPATGRDVALPMVLVCRFAGDRVRQVALYYDAGTLLRQLGLAL